MDVIVPHSRRIEKNSKPVMRSGNPDRKKNFHLECGYIYFHFLLLKICRHAIVLEESPEHSPFNKESTRKLIVLNSREKF